MSELLRPAPRRRAYRMVTRRLIVKLLATYLVYLLALLLLPLALVLFLKGYYTIPLILVAIALGSAVAVYEAFQEIDL